MPFEIGDDIVNNNNQTYLVEKVEVIRLPPDSLGGQGDIARYHYDLKRIVTGQKITINILVEEDPENNIDIQGVTWNKVIARGIKSKKTRSQTRSQTRRRQTKRKRQRQSKGKRRRQ